MYKMDLVWINISEKLREGIKLINNLNNEVFTFILKYIYKTNTTTDYTSDSNLKIKMENIILSSSLSKSDFSFLMKTLSFIIKRSSNFIMKPTKLQSDLKDKIKMNELKSEIYVKYWIDFTKPILDNLEQKTDISNKLENISWNLKVQLSSGGQHKEKTAIGCLAFETKFNDPLSLELNRTEMLNLYEQLEDLQIELDLLKK